MPDQRFAYEPVHDLRSGRFAGVEIVPRRVHDAVAVQARDRGWGARQIAELDASTVVSAVTSARAADGVVPLQVDVAADTVLYARDRLRAVLTVGATSVGAVAPLLEIGPPIAAAAPAEVLVPALAELRRWGFRIGLDGCGRAFGPELVAAVRPDVVKLEPELADGVLDAGTGAAVRAVLEVARAVGVPVAATGVRDPDRLTGLYATGVSVAQGPLLGGARPEPTADPATLPELLALLRAAPGGAAVRTTGPATVGPAAPGPAGPAPAGPPVRGLAAPAVTVGADVTGDVARETMREHPDSAGVVLVDAARRPVCYLDRSRFLLSMTGKFGHALWADKPARELADPPRTVDERTPLSRALELSLSGDPARAYDDLVVVAPDGSCRGTVTVAELWRQAILPGAADRPGPRSQAAVSGPHPVPAAAASGAHPVRADAGRRPVHGPSGRPPMSAPAARHGPGPGDGRTARSA
ncbi:EAL domain protein [Pseudonocardia sp. Ae168_Ps1]|uniref:EAL domain-containing protein n=1 Tax=unclassified Pseudonocardia TaxID=2619320 RepID=UPI00094B56BA|nr:MULTISPECIES: EAL domain-containing protein [unclassified Pseudonocardia]OLL75708.1 EAL domain protein [Pseudonocardia sp. Ae150A_Ps1]OLL81707.1 EAL domain protein [Pseudonocardia sp. Ae168_Ps1]OLL84180.1 EAL domain protein [Pseudonocardia sp. Ae263_Ps1]OLL95802.1 EAL domain protein [Pseudonocardia sp. Ae356_Ps1]